MKIKAKKRVVMGAKSSWSLGNRLYKNAKRADIARKKMEEA